MSPNVYGYNEDEVFLLVRDFQLILNIQEQLYSDGQQEGADLQFLKSENSDISVYFKTCDLRLRKISAHSRSEMHENLHKINEVTLSNLPTI